MFKDIKIGTRVWFQPLGWGEVEEVNEILTYPILVQFGGTYHEEFTAEGFYTEDYKVQSLFLEYTTELKLDDLLVVTAGDGTKYKRYFSHYTGENKNVVACFRLDMTSLTANTNEVSTFDEWRLYNG